MKAMAESAASPVTYFRSVCCGRFDLECGCRATATPTHAEAEDGFEMRSELNAMTLFVQKLAAPVVYEY